MAATDAMYSRHPRALSLRSWWWW